jgi:hypothetical protein
MIAAIMAGDVSYTTTNMSAGILAALGLKSYGGKPADMTAWKTVLAHERPRTQYLPQVPQRPGVLTITGGDQHVGAAGRHQSW